MKKNYIVCLIIIVVIVFCGLYLKTNFNNKIDISLEYQNFIDKQKYLNDYDNEYTKVSYTLYDLDKNGIDELIIYLNNDTDFGTNLIYTYSDNKIVFIDKIYHFGNLNYNESEKLIVYTDIRPSLAYGSAYGFYKLENNQIVLNKMLSVEINDNISKYYIFEDKDNKVQISEDEFNKYFNDNIVLDSKYIKVK